MADQPLNRDEIEMLAAFAGNTSQILRGMNVQVDPRAVVNEAIRGIVPPQSHAPVTSMDGQPIRPYVPPKGLTSAALPRKTEAQPQPAPTPLPTESVTVPAPVPVPVQNLTNVQVSPPSDTNQKELNLFPTLTLDDVMREVYSLQESIKTVNKLLKQIAEKVSVLDTIQDT